jgi:L-aspartate oxidase
MAHATNGGASIDMNGFTGVPGLYACGECASGMHGANRIGGAMVLATQVFGARAGKAAAGYSYDTSFLRSHAFNEFLAKKLEESEEENLEWLQGRSWLKHALQEKAILGGRSDLYKLKRDLEERLKSYTDWKLRLYIESALMLVEFLCKKTC